MKDKWIIIVKDGNILPFEYDISDNYITLNQIIKQNIKDAIKYTKREKFYKDIVKIIFKKEDDK